MSDFDPTPLLDELERVRTRAEAAEARANELADAVHWLVVGSNGLTSDGYLPDLAMSTLLRDDVPIAKKDAVTAAMLYALRHGTLLAFAALRDEATEDVQQAARNLAGDLDIHASDLAKRSEHEVAKLAAYLHKRGAMEL